MKTNSMKDKEDDGNDEKVNRRGEGTKKEIRKNKRKGGKGICEGRKRGGRKK